MKVSFKQLKIRIKMKNSLKAKRFSFTKLYSRKTDRGSKNKQAETRECLSFLNLINQQTILKIVNHYCCVH